MEGQVNRHLDRQKTNVSKLDSKVDFCLTCGQNFKNSSWNLAFKRMGWKERQWKKKKNASSNIRLLHRGMKTSCLGLREQEITLVQKEALRAQGLQKASSTGACYFCVYSSENLFGDILPTSDKLCEITILNPIHYQFNIISIKMCHWAYADVSISPVVRKLNLLLHTTPTL